MVRSRWIGAWALTAGSVLQCGFACAGTLTTLYSFAGGKDGASPASALIPGPNGSFYGTTRKGGSKAGAKGFGTVFQLSPPAEGTGPWTLRTLNRFSGGYDGGYPQGLVADPSGALYGVTLSGGQINQSPCQPSGCGTIFKLTPPAPGHSNWGFSTLYTFTGLFDGSYPTFGLAIDTSGNLYGATQFGGSASHAGTVFRLVPPEEGIPNWRLFTIHTFTGGADGGVPYGGVIVDGAGDVFGTTSEGGNSDNNTCALVQSGCGTVFKLTPSASSGTGYTHKVILSFNGHNGNTPYSGLTLDSAGNLYGSTLVGGDLSKTAKCGFTPLGQGCGVLFELSPPGPGETRWTDTTLFKFKGDKSGNQPFDAPVFMGNEGFITTLRQGSHPTGTVDAFTVGGSGKTNGRLMPVYNFSLDFWGLHSIDGALPQAALLLQNGVLYGTTTIGGKADAGSIFQYRP